MENDKELREQRTTALDAADVIVKAAENDSRSLTDEEKTEVDSHLTTADEAKVALEKIDALRALRSQIDGEKSYQVPDSQRTPAGDPPSKPTFRAEVNTPEYEAGDAMGALIAARMQFGQDKPAAERWSEDKFGSGSKQFRAMQQSTFTAGGALIEDNFVGAELIELLRATAAVRRAGARSIPLVGGSATIPKITGGSTHSWGQEGENITASELTTGNVTLVEKKSTVLVPFSNDLARNASLEVTRMIRDDMVRAAANGEDSAFLNGTGLNNQPKGIFNWVGAAGQTATAGVTLANVRTDIRVAKNALGTANAPVVNRAWFMHSRTANFMGWDLVDGNSNFAFPQLQDATSTGNVSLGGARVFEDNNVPLTGGSQIFYVEMSECFIGDNGSLELSIFENATYVDSGGNMRSGISRDESVIRLIRKLDFAMRHTESAHVITGVIYGA